MQRAERVQLCRRPSRRLRVLARAVTTLLAVGGVLALADGVAGAQTGDTAGSGLSAPGTTAASLEQCVTSVVQTERSATFMGEMTAIAGTSKMSMRIDVQERTAGQSEYHVLNAPGLGVWRAADPKVKLYKYLKQVTNLSPDASYRALVRFRWIGAKGRVIRRAERLTPRCLQPATPPEPQPAPTTVPPEASASQPATGGTG
ncbi:MAG TPA: hypothetical protein VGH09_04465 [Solirubrobacteraceae bacterium]|jgi:hypothetical protein